MLGYVALSWAVRFDMRLGGQIASLVYPLDTFSMYAVPSGRDTSMLLVRDQSGRAYRVTEFTAYECEQAPAGSPQACPHTRGIPYLHEEFAAWVESHRGPGDTDAELITRTWDVRPWAAPVHVGDCVVARCRVGRL